MLKRFHKVTFSLVFLLALATTSAAALVYRTRTYPGVSVQGIDVGGLTAEEVEAQLSDHLPRSTLELRAGEHRWQFSGTDFGRRYDYQATARKAYEVARQGAWHRRLRSIWRLWREGRSIDAVIVAAEPERVRDALQRIAEQVAVDASDAQLRIAADGVTATSGRAGQVLDIEASAAKVLQALKDGATTVELVVEPVPPRLAEPEPAYTLARTLLAQPFALIADDPLTDYHAEFTAPPARVAEWLQATPDYTAGAAKMTLEVDRAAVRGWLDEVAPQLGAERILDVDETLTHATEALLDGSHEAEAHIRHPASTYIVQPGDILFNIAYEHGFPQWRLEEANPDVDPDSLVVGMELTIPSIDVLFPEPLVPNKYIEIDLPEQQLRAYENDELVFDFTCSTGVSTTPTIAGQFQVLFKEPNAYAQRWDLEMPYFMAIYQEGPDFYNGIHELPIMSGGRRLWSGALGWPASYGCIILDIGDSEKLYDWAPVGTLVHITGTAPGTLTYEERLEQAQEADE